MSSEAVTGDAMLQGGESTDDDAKKENPGLDALEAKLAAADANSVSSVQKSNVEVTNIESDDRIASELISKETTKRKRLPYDSIGKVQDELELNPSNVVLFRKLIDELLKKDKLDEIRDAYNNFLSTRSTWAPVLNEYVDFELEQNNFKAVESIFTKYLRKVLDLSFWQKYLNYVRRRQDTTVGNVKAIEVVTQAYEFVLAHVGYDIDSGKIWKEYIVFLKSKPTKSTWEEQQKVDSTRRWYRKAVTYPIIEVESIWKEYDHFENSVNRSSARKMLAEVSPAYMSARAALRELKQKIEGIHTKDGSLEPSWSDQDKDKLSRIRDWINWEKSNPLSLDNPTLLENRIKFAYKKALLTLYHYPEIWFEAATWYHSKDSNEELKIIREGVLANPRSMLLRLRLLELEESQQSFVNIKDHFDSLLNSTSSYISKMMQNFEENKQTLLKVQDESKHNQSTIQKNALAINQLEKEKNSLVRQYSDKMGVIWSFYMLTVRRTEGLKAARQIFGKARKSEFQSFHIYVISALMEYHCSKDSSIALKVFELGLRTHFDNADYVQAYLQFLISINDENNARILFEKTIQKLQSGASRICEIWYKYQSWYGELTSANHIKEKMPELYAEKYDELDIIIKKYSIFGFNPFSVDELNPDRITIKELNNMVVQPPAEVKLELDAPQPTIEALIKLIEELPKSSLYNGISIRTNRLLDILQAIILPEDDDNITENAQEAAKKRKI